MNQNYIYLLSDQHKMYFYVYHKILLISSCHEMKKIENGWCRGNKIIYLKHLVLCLARIKSIKFQKNLAVF